MPGLDGFDVCQRIKAKEETKATAIIAVTAHHSTMAESRILELGARAYLQKPLDIAVLIAEVESALADAT